MDEFKVRFGGLPVGLLTAIIVTMVLFIALPLLTQFQRSFKAKEKIQGTLISTRKPPEVRDEAQDEPKKQEMKQQETKKEMKKVQRAQPKFDAPHAKIGMAGTSVGGIKIGMVDNFEVSDSLFMSAFNLNEVDQKPQVLRSFPPQYPYMAKRDNIEGRIVLKFVVDTDGNAKEPEVVSADPPEVLEMFSDAALKAVERYKFKPAMKNGKAVLCIVKLPIVFAMED